MTYKGRMLNVRCDDEILAFLESYREEHSLLTISEAVRALILESRGGVKPPRYGAHTITMELDTPTYRKVIGYVDTGVVLSPDVLFRESVPLWEEEQLRRKENTRKLLASVGDDSAVVYAQPDTGTQRGGSSK